MPFRPSDAANTPLRAQAAVWWHERRVTCRHCRRTYRLKAGDEVDLFGDTTLYAAGRFRCRHYDTWNVLDRPPT